jgi:hypothetical protein
MPPNRVKAVYRLRAWFRAGRRLSVLVIGCQPPARLLSMPSCANSEASSSR